MLETPWGYDIDATELPPLIELADFHEMTGSKFSQDSRLQTSIDAVTARARMWCGWHIWPRLTCEVVIDGGERCVWLPASVVSEVLSVTVGGTTLDASKYQWGRDGRLRLPRTPDELRHITVRYVAGLAGDACPSELADLVAHRVVHNVALPFGVASESSGGVSVSYSTDATSNAGGPNLTARDRDTLAAYKLWEAR